jgi:Protein of unknown function (DUF3225)
MLINDPETVAELAAIYPQYETALITNDIPTMQRLFWASPHVVRFGATENLHGIEEIEAFRAARSATNLARQITRLDVTTFGKDFGCVHLEFERRKDNQIIRGRQSQTWVRLPEGWRVVAAHVSFLPG